MDDASLEHLREQIDRALLAFDSQLCEHGRKSGVAREAIGVVGLSGGELVAVIASFARDMRLWTEFRRQISQSPEVRFDDLFHTACAPPHKPAPRPATVRPDDADYHDASGWARRINTLSGQAVIDAVTLYAVAHALGNDSVVRRLFHAAVAAAQEHTG